MQGSKAKDCARTFQEQQTTSASPASVGAELRVNDAQQSTLTQYWAKSVYKRTDMLAKVNGN